eukprot:19182-Heterococcus_DN1.PRE.4
MRPALTDNCITNQCQYTKACNTNKAARSGTAKLFAVSMRTSNKSAPTTADNSGTTTATAAAASSHYSTAMERVQYVSECQRRVPPPQCIQTNLENSEDTTSNCLLH